MGFQTGLIVDTNKKYTVTMYHKSNGMASSLPKDELNLEFIIGKMYRTLCYLKK